MQTYDLNELLADNTYPGRGIVLGVDEAGENAVIVYFIMGRSVNSRNRIFEETEEGIITKAHDESLMTDPHLIIYAPVRALPGGETTIVTNGDQTDTIYDFMKDGKASYKLSILKSDNGDENSVLRYFYEYCQPKAGEGRFIHTYVGDGNPIPSFEGEPEKVTIKGDIEQLALNTWENLNADNKVSLYVSFISLKDGSTDTIIINKHDQEEE